MKSARQWLALSGLCCNSGQCEGCGIYWSSCQIHGCPAQELGRLGDDANVFKLIGPALIKQDLVEAKSNVSKRLEYIKGEIERADTQIKSMESKSKQHEQEVGGCSFSTCLVPSCVS